MHFVIDRRLNSRNKSTVNRQRFLNRYRTHIKRAVADAMSGRSMRDMERGESVTIPANDISEPVFQHGVGGHRTIVHPGNKEFTAGQEIARPGGGGGGGGGGKASNQGEGQDDFVFQLSRDEFLNFVFEDLELPNLAKRVLNGNDQYKWVHAGFSSDGSPNKMDVVRSMRTAKSRRIAMGSNSRRELRAAEAELLALLETGSTGSEQVLALEEKIAGLKKRLSRIPWIDTSDLRYHLNMKLPEPTTKAVMFCLMDVSGSMDEATKALAKRFFLLLYLFLQKNYERTDIVFIRHHTVASEVGEDEFFHSRETGGTIVSSALHKMIEVVKARYPVNAWNIYAAQASDGDNWDDDSSNCSKLLVDEILPLSQYYAYVEITQRGPQSLWHEYAGIAKEWADKFAIRRIQGPKDIYGVFRDLFSRQAA